MLLFTFWHRSLIVKSEQGQYWRNEPRNLAGSWRCGFLLTCEIFGLASCVYYTLVTDAAAGRLLWDILFGWSLSIHVHGCTISLVYNIFCWIFCLGHLQRWKSLLDTKVFSFFLFTSCVLLLLSWNIQYFWPSREHSLARISSVHTFIYLFYQWSYNCRWRLLKGSVCELLYSRLLWFFSLLLLPLNHVGVLERTFSDLSIRTTRRTQLRLCSFASNWHRTMVSSSDLEVRQKNNGVTHFPLFVLTPAVKM